MCQFLFLQLPPCALPPSLFPRGCLCNQNEVVTFRARSDYTSSGSLRRRAFDPRRSPYVIIFPAQFCIRRKHPAIKRTREANFRDKCYPTLLTRDLPPTRKNAVHERPLSFFSNLYLDSFVFPKRRSSLPSIAKMLRASLGCIRYQREKQSVSKIFAGHFLCYLKLIFWI